MALSVRSRKFCCCLPVRLGVFILSLLAMVGGSFVAAVGWVQISQLAKHPREKSDEIALWIQTSMFTLLGILAVFGFIGALVKNRGMISSFAIALAIHLGFSIAAGAFALYTLFKESTADGIARCLNDAGDNSDVTAESCRTGLAIVKGLMVAVYIVTWLIQLYAYFIVERYADQLDDEDMAKNTIVIPRTMNEISAPQITGQPVTTYGAFQQQPPYPFTSPRQAFGVGRGQDPSQHV